MSETSQMCLIIAKRYFLEYIIPNNFFLPKRAREFCLWNRVYITTIIGTNLHNGVFSEAINFLSIKNIFFLH